MTGSGGAGKELGQVVRLRNCVLLSTTNSATCTLVRNSLQTVPLSLVTLCFEKDSGIGKRRLWRSGPKRDDNGVRSSNFGDRQRGSVEWGKSRVDGGYSWLQSRTKVALIIQSHGSN
jgi:hypothetical protein